MGTRILLFFVFGYGLISTNIHATTISGKEKFYEYIQKGYIELGMTTNDIKASWGEPKSVKHKKAQDYDEVWIYIPNWKFKNRLFFKNGVLVKTEPNYLVVSKMEGHGVMP